ncbi:hypothetical protein ACOZXQ_002754 [Cronobacter malonaticus]
MSTISNERLEKLSSGNAWTCVQDDEAKAMATELLALRKERERTEPVAYMIGGHYLMHANDPKVDNYSSAVPLYTAPPAPTDKTKSEMSQKAEQLVRETTSLAEKLNAETDTTSQQFESLAGKAVGGSEGFECTPVADLYELLTKCGECYDYTTSAKFAAAWINDGYSAREYVKLDRLQEALFFATPEPCK